MGKDKKIWVAGHKVSARNYANAKAMFASTAKYIKSRREASRRSREIREMVGPHSMEWVQSALFLYACKKHKLDVRDALMAYTSALILKLESVLTDADRIAKRLDQPDSFRWVANQLRWAINKHTKLIDTMNADILVPPISETGTDIKNIVHRPTDKDANEMMNYMVGEFKQKNPEAHSVLPRMDCEL